MSDSNQQTTNDEHPFVFHMVEAKHWGRTLTTGDIYYPPTYEADGFTHGTSNPAKLLTVANHFYSGIDGDWYCLQMTVQSLAATGVKTIYEPAAAVGATASTNEAASGELFPHIYGGIAIAAVINTYPITRDEFGGFRSIDGI
jgi:uncharacterized protein (DUF952 family)